MSATPLRWFHADWHRDQDGTPTQDWCICTREERAA